MTRCGLILLAAGWCAIAVAASAVAQVHYDPANGSPWNQRAEEGPDAEVPGWFYNLGVTGIRAELVANEPTTLVVRYVFPGSIASGLIEAGDVIGGAGGQPFQVPHRNGYGEEVFGGHGPIMDFADALEACQAKKADGKLKLSVLRNGKVKEIVLNVGKAYGSYAPTFPAKCPKSDKILGELLALLARNQNEHGSFGDMLADMYAPLALLASGEERYMPAVTRYVERIAHDAQQKHDPAYDFLHRGTEPNGYVSYGDGASGNPDGWADMGRTGATAIANMLAPYPEPAYRQRALGHARVMGLHPESFPDTHASPMMGMVYQSLGTNVDPPSFRRVMDSNRWWFTMAQCADGTFYYQPNRDNAGYGNTNRVMASAVVALIYSIPKQSLFITGKQPPVAQGKKKPAPKAAAKPAQKAP